MQKELSPLFYLNVGLKFRYVESVDMTILSVIILYEIYKSVSIHVHCYYENINCLLCRFVINTFNVCASANYCYLKHSLSISRAMRLEHCTINQRSWCFIMEQQLMGRKPWCLLRIHYYRLHWEMQENSEILTTHFLPN